ncbi:L,D-transpeptidase family protein [Streptomyces sp. 8N706]|uniref:L,D-transpeptidase family protein n=1 Tax=Streptomyces sp. 8N706 TaxID=3457416 RepID=UPI003FD2ABE1
MRSTGMRSAVKRSGRPFAAVLAVAALLPLVIGGTEAVAAGPEPPGGQGVRGTAVPLEALVPGIPPGEGERHVDTPDQALPPRIPGDVSLPPDAHGGSVAPDAHDGPVTPGAHTGAVPPGAEGPPGRPSSSVREAPGREAGAAHTPGRGPKTHDQAPPPPSPAPPDDTHDPVVELVPPDEVQPGDDAAGPLRCTDSTGPYQREVEEFLRLTVNGTQSKRDCEAIRAWQTKENIEPAIGFAGPSTWGRMRLAEARRDPDPEGLCPVVDGRVACVDLPRQLMWVQYGGRVVFGPVAIRSGKPGYPTRVGWNRIFWKHEDHFSTIYQSPMPFAQFFNGGQAFHGVFGNIYDQEGGSYGCVNLTYQDAKVLWNVLQKDDRVFSWGRRPGT